MPAFMKALASHRGVAALALRFAILTAARPSEVRGATWGEVDLDGAIWTIPAKRMKAGRLHRVPLSAGALELLRSVRPETVAADLLIFAAPRSKRPLSDMSLSLLVRGMSLDGLPEGSPPRWRDATRRTVVPHGVRSTFRDWAGETRPEAWDRFCSREDARNAHGAGPTSGRVSVGVPDGRAAQPNPPDSGTSAAGRCAPNLTTAGACPRSAPGLPPGKPGSPA